MDCGVLQPDLNHRRRRRRLGCVFICAFFYLFFVGEKVHVSVGVHVYVQWMELLYRCMLNVQHVVGCVCLISHVVCVHVQI